MISEDKTCISVDKFLPYPVPSVWKVLTDSDLMAEWLMPNSFRPIIGHEFSLWRPARSDVEWNGEAHCKVLDLKICELLKISWADPGTENKLESTVTWELIAEGRGTRLFIHHDGFDPTNPLQQRTRRLMAGGWRSWVLRQIEELAAIQSTNRGHRRPKHASDTCR